MLIVCPFAKTGVVPQYLLAPAEPADIFLPSLLDRLLCLPTAKRQHCRALPVLFPRLLLRRPSAPEREHGGRHAQHEIGIGPVLRDAVCGSGARGRRAGGLPPVEREAGRWERPSAGIRVGFRFSCVVHACVVLSRPGRPPGGRQGSNSAVQRNTSPAEISAIKHSPLSDRSCHLIADFPF